VAESTHIKATRCWGASERWPTWPAIWTAASIWQLSHNKFRQPVEVSRRQGWLLRRSHTGLSGASRRTYGCRARRSHPGGYELVQLLSQSRRSGVGACRRRGSLQGSHAWQGIGDAFRQAERLAQAIEDGLGNNGLDAAVQRWWRWRDHDSYEKYWFAVMMGAPGVQSPRQRSVFRGIAADDEASHMLFRVLNREVRPSPLFTPERVIRGASGAFRAEPRQNRADAQRDHHLGSPECPTDSAWQQAATGHHLRGMAMIDCERRGPVAGTIETHGTCWDTG
jgi:hypothetical protein